MASFVSRSSAIWKLLADAKESLKELIQKSLQSKCVGDFSLDGLEEGKVVNRIDVDKPGKVSDGPNFSDGKVGGAVALSGDNNVTVPAGGDFTRDQAFSPFILDEST